MSELIDREATVKQICKIGEMVGGHDRDVVISIALFVQDDKTAFPTVERPHGEWVYKNGKYWCSSCGEKAIYHSHIQAPLPHLTNFCPNCGALMSANDRQVIGKLDDNTTLLYSMTNGDNFIGKEGDEQ